MLLFEMKGKGIYECGTVNSTRKNIPGMLDDENLMKGDFDR